MNKTAYILKDGDLSVLDGTLFFKGTDGEESQIPIIQVAELFICARVKFSFDILKLLSNQGVIVHFFKTNEYYLGTYYPKGARFSGELLILEVQHSTDIKKCLDLAHAFLSGAFKNMHRNLNYYFRRGVINSTFVLNDCINEINLCCDINLLMLIEAKYRRQYYSYFSDIIRFDISNNFKRVYPNAQDIINILLNFINSLLYAVIISEIHKTSLSGQIGFLHKSDVNRFALCFDISEVFKPLMVDRLVFALLNKNIIGSEDIKDGRLIESAVKRIFSAWDDLLCTQIYHRELKRHTTYRYLIRNELYKVESHLYGKKEYKPFVIWW